MPDQELRLNVCLGPDLNPVYSWPSQARQYPALGNPGITHRLADPEAGRLLGPFDPVPAKVIDCLLYYGDDGRLAGILNYYGVDFPPHEQAGNCNVWVDPARQRTGIALKLIEEADRRWHLNWEQQRYTEAGVRTVVRYLERKAERGEDW